MNTAVWMTTTAAAGGTMNTPSGSSNTTNATSTGAGAAEVDPVTAAIFIGFVLLLILATALMPKIAEWDYQRRKRKREKQ